MARPEVTGQKLGGDVIEKIGFTIKQAEVASGLSRSTLYELIAEGSLESRVVAGRRIVIGRSLRKLIEGERADQDGGQAAA